MKRTPSAPKERLLPEAKEENFIVTKDRRTLTATRELKYKLFEAFVLSAIPYLQGKFAGPRPEEANPRRETFLVSYTFSSVYSLYLEFLGPQGRNRPLVFGRNVFQKEFKELATKLFDLKVHTELDGDSRRNLVWVSLPNLENLEVTLGTSDKVVLEFYGIAAPTPNPDQSRVLQDEATAEK
jgi:hypothetical protein